MTLPNTYALLIGMADYQQVTRLPQQVRNDVQDVHAVLVIPHLCTYPPENVTLLLDGLPLSAPNCLLVRRIGYDTMNCQYSVGVIPSIRSQTIVFCG